MGSVISKNNININEFDCIIPTAGRDCIIVRKSIDLIYRFLKPSNIFIITKKEFFIYFTNKRKQNVTLIDEDELCDGLNYNFIKEKLLSVNYSSKMTGWFFQQFLKMGFAFSQYSNKYYLTWDADTIPTKRIDFFSEDSIPFFTMKDEYNVPYFDTIKSLLGLDKTCEKSFISENMMFDKDIMIELIDSINKSNAKGNFWFEKIINSLPPNKINSFSEFETYGTYVSNYHKNKYTQRELRTFRNAGLFHTRLIREKKIINYSDKYDMLSLEHGHNPTGLMRYISLLQKTIILVVNKILLKIN